MSAPTTTATRRDIAALFLHDARCDGGDCDGPVFRDYAAADRLLEALTRAADTRPEDTR